MPSCSASQTPGSPQDWLIEVTQAYSRDSLLPLFLAALQDLKSPLPLLKHQLSPLFDKAWHFQTYYLRFTLNSAPSDFLLLICLGCRWFEFLLKYLILLFPKSKWANILEEFQHLLNSVLLDPRAILKSSCLMSWQYWHGWSLPRWTTFFFKIFIWWWWWWWLMMMMMITLKWILSKRNTWLLLGWLLGS